MLLLTIFGAWMALACLTALFAVALIRGGRSEDLVEPADAGLHPVVLLPRQRVAVEVAVDAAF